MHAPTNVTPKRGISPRAVVLLSGGMDSAICAVFASRDSDEVLAIHVCYGQPSRDAESFASRTIAAALEIDHVTVYGHGIVPSPTRLGVAVDQKSAILPGRNAVLLSIAASHGAARWPGLPFDVWIGSCADDAAFADCRSDFLSAQSYALTMAVGAGVRVIAPVAAMTKRESLASMADDVDLSVVRSSFSCYRGTLCKQCPPCLLRADAFSAAGLIDASAVPTMSGGDPSREAVR